MKFLRLVALLESVEAVFELLAGQLDLRLGDGL